MVKWKAVKVKQELVEQVEKEVARSEYKGLSDFVSDAIKQRLQTLAKQRVSEYLERDRVASAPKVQGQIFYTPQRVWAKMTPEGEVMIGITDSFQNQLREIVNIRTEVVGESVSKDQTFGVAESWWFTHDLYSPINGEIVAINEEVIQNPFILNVDPSLWIVKIQPNPAEINSLLNALPDSQKHQESAARPAAQASQL